MRNTFVLMLAVAVSLSLCPLVFATVADYRTAALGNAGIMHYYSMENAANRGEDTAGSYHLTETPYGAGDIANIIYGTANLFGGTSTFMTPESGADPNTDGAALYDDSFGFQATSPMTVEVIMKVGTDEVGNNPVHVLSGGASTDRGNFLYQEAGTLGLGAWVGPDRQQFFEAHPDKWYYLAMVLTIDGFTTDIAGSYANLSDGGGLMPLSATHDGTYRMGGTNLAVGMHNSVRLAFLGSLDEVAFYGAGLSESEIASNFSALAASDGTPGDLDGDGDVDGNDFLLAQVSADPAAAIALWTQNYGSLSAVTAVPEPGSSLLALVGLLVVGGSRRRKLKW